MLILLQYGDLTIFCYLFYSGMDHPSNLPLGLWTLRISVISLTDMLATPGDSEAPTEWERVERALERRF